MDDSVSYRGDPAHSFTLHEMNSDSFQITEFQGSVKLTIKSSVFLFETSAATVFLGQWRVALANALKFCKENYALTPGTHEESSDLTKRVQKVEALEIIQPLLEKYQNILKEKKGFDTSAFDAEFSPLLRVVSIKGIDEAVDYLARKTNYHPVLVYYMQQRTPGPRDEVKLLLAKAFGCKAYDTDECKAKEAEYWKAFHSKGPA